LLKNTLPISRNTLTSTRANILWATAQQVIEKAAGYLVIAVLTRTLLQVELGTMFFCLSISELTTVALSYGTHTYLVRITASDPENSLSHLSRVLSMRLSNIGLGYIVLNSIIYIVRPDIMPVMLLASAYDLLEEIYFTFSAFFIGRKRLIYPLVVLGGFKMLNLIGVTIISYLTRSLFHVLWTYFLLDILLVLICFTLVRLRFGRITLRLDLRDNLKLMRETTPFFLIDLLNVLHIRFDTILVGVLLTLQKVAVYEIGVKLMEVTRFLMRPLVNVFLPLLSQYAIAGRWKLFRKRYLQLIGIAFGAGLLLTSGMKLFGSRLIVLMFSETYRESIVPAQILFYGIPFLYISMMNAVSANALHLEKRLTLISAISVSLNLILNFLLIPRYGILGAAWTTVSSQVLEASLGMILVSTTIFKPKKDQNV